jgi:hypothetical protein
MPIDLNAARAARREAAGAPPEPVVFGDREFPLPVELPVSVMEGLARLGTLPGNDAAGITSTVKEILAELFGEHFDAFWALRPSFDDLMELMDRLPAAYGFGGESNRAQRRAARKKTPRTPAKG